ncbi:MAG: HAD family hydrolase [Actinobacteria bacterium]|nr:MAG: HAD family hydrolase [Actinomycetota bacterium]
MKRWATFDCYGTLVDWRAGIRAQLARIFPDADVDALLGRYYEIEPDVQRDGALPYRVVLAQTLARVAVESGRSVPPGDEDALAASLPDWPVFPEVREALLEIRERGWRLGILSNTDRDLIDQSVAVLAVPFDLVVVASEIGAYKPAHRHWEVFAARTGATPDRHVHVAQSLFHDVAATNELGIRSVWINRLEETPGPVPTRSQSDLAGLADVLDELVPL